MCGIAGSKDPLQALKLAEGFKDRGTRTWSISVVDLKTFLKPYIIGAQEEFSLENGQSHLEAHRGKYDIYDPYYIVHLHSPTAKHSSHHPAFSEKGKEVWLWHNGMKDSRKLQSGEWDTQSLADEYSVRGSKAFEDFEGSLAIILLVKGEGLFYMRNRISPLFRRDSKGDFQLSSRYLVDGGPVPPNSLLSLSEGLDSEGIYLNNTYNPYGTN